MDKHDFTKNVEKMINPIDVGTILYMQSYMKVVPASLQYKIIKSGSNKNPYMGFVVEPYSFFLCYELKDLEYAKRLIPDNYRLIKTSIFANDDPKYYCIFGMFNVHSSVFWGTRMEFYIIAENINTGLLSWVIVDYDTNTVSFDERYGLSGGNTNICVLTTNFDGEVIADIQNPEKQRKIVATGRIKNALKQDLNQRLWLEGNLSVTYGRDISNNKGEPFAVIFNPLEVATGLQIPLEDVLIESNTWFKGLYDEKPSIVASFPFAQHFLSDSPGHFSQIRNEKELQEKFDDLDFKTIPNYSSQPIKKAMQKGQLMSFILIIILIVLLIIK